MVAQKKEEECRGRNDHTRRMTLGAVLNVVGASRREHCDFLHKRVDLTTHYRTKTPVSSAGAGGAGKRRELGLCEQ